MRKKKTLLAVGGSLGLGLIFFLVRALWNNIKPGRQAQTLARPIVKPDELERWEVGWVDPKQIAYDPNTAECFLHKNAEVLRPWAHPSQREIIRFGDSTLHVFADEGSLTSFMESCSELPAGHNPKDYLSLKVNLQGKVRV